MDNDNKVFISYATPQKNWADWIYNEISAINFVVEMDSKNWKVGESLLDNINEAIMSNHFILAIWSNDYFSDKRWTKDELHAAYTRFRKEKLVILPFHVEPNVVVPPVFENIISINLYDLSEYDARRELRSCFQKYTENELDKIPLPRKKVNFPNNNKLPIPNEFKITSMELRSLLDMAGEQAKKVLKQKEERISYFTIEDIGNKIDNLSRSYNSEPAINILENTIALLNDLDFVFDSYRYDPTKLIEIMILKCQAHGLVAYSCLDIGETDFAYSNALAARKFAESANHEELIAWAYGTQALINRMNKNYDNALKNATDGLNLTVTGMARSRLLCQAALSYAEKDDLYRIKSLLEESEKSISNTSIANPNEAKGIFYFSKAKHHYYAGNALMRKRFNQASQAEKETRLAIQLFDEGDIDSQSEADKKIALIHLAISLSNQERIDEVLELLNPIMNLRPEYRSSWQLRWLQRLKFDLQKDERLNNSTDAKNIYEAIQDYEIGLYNYVNPS